MNNRFLNKILVALVLASVGLGVGAIAILDSQDLTIKKETTSLKVTGSSTVYPLWVKAQDRLLTSLPNHSVNVEVTSTGSGNGVKDAKAGKTDFGNASRDPKTSDSEAGSGWENMRTVQLGIDALSIYIKVPAACTDTTITTTPDKIVMAYTGLTDAQLTTLSAGTGDTTAAAAGNNVTITRGTASVTVSSQNTQMSILANSTCTESIVLYGRNTTASGTRDGFLKIADRSQNTNQSWLDDEIFDTILEARKEANQLDTTNEANSAAVQAVESSNGGASYVSFGFVSSKSATADSDRLAVPTIDFGQGQITASVATILSRDYNWTRPLNTIIDVRNESLSAITEVLNYFRKGAGRATVREAGFIPISRTTADATISYVYTDQELKDSGEVIPWLS